MGLCHKFPTQGNFWRNILCLLCHKFPNPGNLCKNISAYCVINFQPQEIFVEPFKASCVINFQTQEICVKIYQLLCHKFPTPGNFSQNQLKLLVSNISKPRKFLESHPQPLVS